MRSKFLCNIWQSCYSSSTQKRWWQNIFWRLQLNVIIDVVEDDVDVGGWCIMLHSAYLLQIKVNAQATANPFELSLELGYHQFKMQNVGLNFFLLIAILIDCSIWDQFEFRSNFKVFWFPISLFAQLNMVIAFGQKWWKNSFSIPLTSNQIELWSQGRPWNIFQEKNWLTPKIRK